MLKKAVPNLKRWVSGYLVAVMTLMLVFNNSFAFSALAAETASGSNAEKEAFAIIDYSPFGRKRMGLR